jgi:hypothetical protein
MNLTQIACSSIFCILFCTYLSITCKAQNHSRSTSLDEIISSFQSIENREIGTKEWSMIQSCARGEYEALYDISLLLIQEKSNIFGSDSISTGLKVLEYIANNGHLKAQIALANLFKVGKKPSINRSTSKTLHYLQLAGDQGHHPSLYNTGYIFATGRTSDDMEDVNEGMVPKDLVAAFAYLHAAATYHLKFPEYAEPHVTDASRQALSLLSSSIPDINLSIRQQADIFIFGTHNEISPDVHEMWATAVTALIAFNETFVKTNGSKQDKVQMKEAFSVLRKILTSHKNELSDLQLYLALDNLNDMVGPLAATGDEYVREAGMYAESLALTKLCYDRYAVTEKDSACFNGAAASAVSYFRRIGDYEGAERVILLGNEHPFASTHWRNILQTPRVFHPDLRSKPWWNADEFSAARKLKTLYENEQARGIIINEIKTIIALYEGDLRGSELVVVSDNGPNEPKNGTVGFQRIFTPYIGVRTKDDVTQESGAGGWAEFGPLFDGQHWSKERCAIVPTLCKILENDESLCSNFKKVSSIPFSATVSNWDLCGSGTIVTILRLRPGTSILPHCGTTNSRLIMHFPIIGAEGVKFIVGDETVLSYGGGDGHPIVFDDSYEHHVYHEGFLDRYILLAVLGHPDLNPFH